MFETLFTLTTIFVAYVVYAIVDEQKKSAQSKVHAQAITPKAPQTAVPAEASPVIAEEKPVMTKPVSAKKTTPKVAAKAKPKTAATKPATAVKTPVTAVQNSGLKNPTTGEVAATYSNYRFTKRWIKEALVAEGLLDKIYKNNELNADTEASIKQALAKLEALEQYKA